MSVQFRLASTSSILIALMLGVLPGNASASSQQAAFALVDDELLIQLKQDDRAIKDGKFRLVDLAGQPIAEGDLDEDGKQSIPLPEGQTFLVGLTIPGKKKEADVIVLRRHGKTLTPPLVQLSFSKPCCRVIAARTPSAAPTPAESPPEELRRLDRWTTLLGTGGGCLVALATVVYFFRRP